MRDMHMTGWRRGAVGLLAALLLVAAATGCGDEGGSQGDAPDNDVNNDVNNDPNNDVNNTPNNDDNNDNNDDVNPGLFPDDGCDPIQPGYCALPWPSNLYLAPDPTRETGLTLRFAPESLPANARGAHVAPGDYAQMDGYGVGTPIVAHFPDLDFSALPDETAIEASLADDSPVVLLEVGDEGVRRVPCWAEPDLQEPEPGHRALHIRPAEILKEATRYVVALRGLVDTDGQPIAPSPAFEALRSGQGERYDALRGRAARFEEAFEALEEIGVARGELTLAWDFVTASSQALHGKMLSMRDQGLAALEADGYEMTIERIEDFSPEDNDRIAFEVQGTFKTPDFMRPAQVGTLTASRINVDDQGTPVQSGWTQAPFTVRVPRVALDGPPMGLVLYGHGLNGTGRGEVVAGYNQTIGQEHGLIFYATDMWGMSNEDVAVITAIVPDMSQFTVLPDRIHQGLLNHVVLTRLMVEHFPGLPEIQERSVAVDTSRVYYSGISQGGIYGASFMALSPETTRGHLGVPGSNYSLLLHRSVDFTPFLILLQIHYPDSVDRMIALAAAQTLWDRVDPVSYYRHLNRDPFPGTPPSDVLMASATGDYQVALISNEITARSGIGVALMTDYGKEVPLVDPTPYPHNGSGLVNYSFGNPWPAPGNLPHEDDLGDPHGKGRSRAHHQFQMVHFWLTGQIMDVCGGDGCTPD